MQRSQFARAAAFGALAIAVVVLAIILFTGSSGYVLHATLNTKSMNGRGWHESQEAEVLGMCRLSYSAVLRPPLWSYAFERTTQEKTRITLLSLRR